jgi:general secretion pathway protein D
MIRIALALILAAFCLAPGAQPFGKADLKVLNMEFKDAQISDVVRIISEASGLNIVATNEAAQKRVTLYLHDVSARQALEIISKTGGLWYRHDPDVDAYRLMTTEEYQKDLAVFREEKTRIFQLLYPNPVSVATAIRNLYGRRVRFSLAQNEEGMIPLMGAGGMGGGVGGGAGGAGGAGAGAGGIGGAGGVGGAGGIGGAGGVGGFGGGGGAGDGGQFARDPSMGAGDFARSSGAGQSRQVYREELTPDQIQTLEKRMGENREVVTSEQLKGITRQDADIFIVVVPDQNLVAVRTSDLDAMDNIERLIKEMDKPTSEVLLEMKVLDLTLGDSFHSVFDVQLKDGKSTFGLGNFTLGNLTNLTGPTLVYKFLDDHLKANIELLARENRVDVLATPMLMASNNRPAQIFIGEEKVLITDIDSNVVTPGVGAAVTTINLTTEVRNVGNTLRILPKINADRTVTLNVLQDTSSVLPKSTNIPVAVAQGQELREFPIDTVNTANLNATVVAKDGMTVAIGGMVRTTISNDFQKVPLLGDIPYLGALFRRELRDKKKTELVLLITPHIIMAPNEAQAVSDRVAPELSAHPYFDNGDGAYQYYFDKFDPEGADDRPWAQPPNPHPKHPRVRLRTPDSAAKQSRARAETAVKQAYAELTRFAAKAVRQPVAPGEVPQGVRPENLGAEQETVALLAEAGVDATPLQGWRKGDLYVTAVEVKNRLRLPVTVDHTRIYGRWLAATIEKPRLAERGEEGDLTHLYVISAEPFRDALARRSAP